MTLDVQRHASIKFGVKHGVCESELLLRALSGGGGGGVALPQTLTPAPPAFRERKGLVHRIPLCGDSARQGGLGLE